MRISDWSSDVCSSDLQPEQIGLNCRPYIRNDSFTEPGNEIIARSRGQRQNNDNHEQIMKIGGYVPSTGHKSLVDYPLETAGNSERRSEEHTSKLESLMRISTTVFCVNKKNKQMTAKA